MIEFLLALVITGKADIYDDITIYSHKQPPYVKERTYVVIEYSVSY